MAMRAEFRVAFESQGAALIIRQPELDGVQSPLGTEIDLPLVILESLPNPRCVGHDSVNRLPAPDLPLH